MIIKIEGFIDVDSEMYGSSKEIILREVGETIKEILNLATGTIRFIELKLTEKEK